MDETNGGSHSRREKSKEQNQGGIEEGQEGGKGSRENEESEGEGAKR